MKWIEPIVFSKSSGNLIVFRRMDRQTSGWIQYTPIPPSVERGDNKIHPVIVKFRFQDDKWDVMKARRALTDSRISFAEDMCWELQDLQKVVANPAGVQACWSWKKKIVAKDLCGKIKSVPYGNNWRSLFLITCPLWPRTYGRGGPWGRLCALFNSLTKSLEANWADNKYPSRHISLEWFEISTGIKVERWLTAMWLLVAYKWLAWCSKASGHLWEQGLLYWYLQCLFFRLMLMLFYLILLTHINHDNGLVPEWRSSSLMLWSCVSFA